MGELLLLVDIINWSGIVGFFNIFKVCLFGFVMNILNDSGMSFNFNGYVNSVNGLLFKLIGEDFVLGLWIV